jgi:O-antigen ligase
MEITKIKRYFLERGMLLFYAVFVAGYFLMPMASGHRRLYYILVFPAVLFLFKELRQFYRGNALFMLVVIYAGYMMTTLLWSDNFSAQGAGWAVWNSVNALSFCFVSGFLWIHHHQKMNAFAHRAIWIAAAVALTSIVVWYIDHSFPGDRLQPLGVMHHENKAAAAYGIFLILAIHYLFNEPGNPNKLYYLLPALVIFALVALSQSRTAMAAVFAGLLVLLGWRAILLVVAGLVVNWFLLAANQAYWVDRVATFSFRPGIWQSVIENMQGHWLLGYGYLVNEEVQAYGKVFDHAHNSYLASLRDGGLPGLALMLAFLGVALWWSVSLYREKGNRIYLALLLYSMTCIAMDFDRLLTAPKELWLYFWLPIGLIMAAYPHNCSKGSEPDYEKSKI